MPLPDLAKLAANYQWKTFRIDVPSGSFQPFIDGDPDRWSLMLSGPGVWQGILAPQDDPSGFNGIMLNGLQYTLLTFQDLGPWICQPLGLTSPTIGVALAVSISIRKSASSIFEERT